LEKMDPITLKKTEETVDFVLVKNESELPGWTSMEALTDFIHHKMKPYEDKPEDVGKGLNYAFSDGSNGRDGFAILASIDDKLAGVVVFLKTGMGGYVPENLLLFVSVDPKLRNRGIGGHLIERALDYCKGSVKLHVEPDNPAKRLYERIGFSSKYYEMRYVR